MMCCVINELSVYLKIMFYFLLVGGQTRFLGRSEAGTCISSDTPCQAQQRESAWYSWHQVPITTNHASLPSISQFPQKEPIRITQYLADTLQKDTISP